MHVIEKLNFFRSLLILVVLFRKYLDKRTEGAILLIKRKSLRRY